MAKKESKEKIWSKEQAEERYILGDRISLAELAKLSGRCDRTLKGWCVKHDWVRQRREYQDTLLSTKRKKIIQLESDRLAQEYVSRNHEHLQCFEVMRKLAMRYFTRLASEKEKFHSMDFNRMANALNIAIAGEREATGMRFDQDLNHSFRVILADGYSIHDDTGEESIDVFAEDDE